MLPTDSTIGVHVSANLNPVSFEYWYGVGFDNVTIMYKIVRVFGYKIVLWMDNRVQVFGFSSSCVGNKLMKGERISSSL